ncbi:MAG: serine hydrolase domain-containing protein [Candidatus Odinarchaeota archaeon]
MEDYLNSKNFSGTILAKKDGKTIFAKAMGYANLSYRVPNNMDTMYGLASIGKLFTAISALLLLKEKKMTPVDVVHPYLEAIDIEVPEDVTFHHLLTHTGGVERYYTIDPHFMPQSSVEQDRWKAFWKKHPNFLLQTPVDYLPFLKDMDFIHPVGETFYYTNTSYILLGILIQMISGQSYHEYVMNKIIKKLDLKRTRFLAFDEVHENVAEGYTPHYHQGTIIKWKKNIYRLPIVGSADGGIFSNVDDLDRFFKELRNEKGMMSDIIPDLIYPHVLMEKTETWESYYGYGITLTYQNGELYRYGLAGGDYGVATGAYYYPKERLTIIILSNYNTNNDNWMFDKEFHVQFIDL